MLWTLDSCGCQFEVDWDDVGKQNVLRKIVKDCGVHGALSQQALFDTARENNGRKNAAWAVLESNTQITVDVFNNIWSFDSTRTLHINLSRLNISTATKTSLQDKLTTQFGVGKVVVD